MDAAIQAFIDSHPGDQKIIAETLLFWQNRYYEIAKDRRTKCDFCDEVLTGDEIRELRVTDFCFTCSKHTKYRSVFEIDTVREQLGLGHRVVVFTPKEELLKLINPPSNQP